MLLEKIKCTIGITRDPVKSAIQNMMWEVYRAMPSARLKLMFKDYCFLAGGSIRSLYTGKKVKDWDIFFKSDSMAKYFIEVLKLTNPDGKYIFKFESKHTYTIMVNGEEIQFCLGQYAGEPEYVISKFDYTNSMAYYDLSSAELVLPEKFINACDNKLIEFNPDAFTPKVAAQRYNSFEDDGWIDVTPLTTARSIVKSLGKRSKDDNSFG